MEAFGRGLVLEPYFATVILGGGLLRRVATAAQQQALLPQVAQGKLKLAFAHVERQSRYDLADVAATARQDGPNWVLDGAKSVVLHGDCADRLLVTARAVRQPPRPRRHRPVRRRSLSRRRHPARLSDPGRSARRRGHAVRRARFAGRRDAGRAAGDRARGGRSDRRAVRRSGRHHAGDARDDAGVSQDAPAVRPADRAVPGTAAPLGGHAGGARTGTQHGDVRCRHGGRGRRRRTPPRDRRRQGADRPLRQADRPGGDPTARRDRHDDGVQGRPSLQAHDDDRQAVRRRRCTAWRRWRSSAACSAVRRRRRRDQPASRRSVAASSSGSRSEAARSHTPSALPAV